MLKHVFRIVGLNRILLVLSLLLPMAAIEVVTLIGIRFFFTSLQNVAAPAGTLSVVAWVPADWDGFRTAMVLGFVLVVVLVLRALISHAIWLRVLTIITRLQAQISNRLFENFLNLPLDERFSRTVSEQKHTLLLSAQAMFHQVLLPLTAVLVESVVALAIVGTLLTLQPVATVLVTSWIALLFYSYHFVSKRTAARAGRERWKALHGMRELSDGALGDLRWVRITKAESILTRLFGEQSGAYSRALAMDRALAMLSRYLVEITIVSAILILTAYYHLFGSEQGGLLAGLTLFAAGSIRLLPAFQRVVSVSHSLLNHAPDLGQVVAGLNTSYASPKPNSGESQELKQLFTQAICLSGVGFAFHSHESPTLSGIDLVLEPGQRVMITGPSGSGKSTLLSLVLGLLKPSEGSITLDGVETDMLDAVRGARVALVPQDPFIVTGTIAENITFPWPALELDQSFALSLLEAVGLHEDLTQNVGENGAKLSGGERQRLALVRALYLRPNFLVLDEATSQMDEVSARRAYDLVVKTCPDATLLFSTHQPLPAAYCSRHLSVTNGKVAEKPLHG